MLFFFEDGKKITKSVKSERGGRMSEREREIDLNEPEP